MIRWRVPLGFLLAAGYLFAATSASKATYALCAVLVALGCGLRAWAAGYLFKGKRVAVGGPYAFIRNPLYVGSFLIGCGFCLVLWRWPLPLFSAVIVVAFLLGFGVVYRAKTLAEGVELEAHLGEPYKHYASMVPPFLPTRGRVAGLGEQHFSWELYKRNREYECLLGSLAILVYIYFRSFYAG